MKIGIVGTTGLVGRTILKVMEEYQIEIDDLRLMASPRSDGKVLSYKGKDYRVEKISEEIMNEKFDYLFFSAGKEISLKYATIAEKAGSIVIDNSSAFRKDRPLIVPEINGDLISNYRGIIANPNCSTIQLVIALDGLHRAFRLKKLIISTYQSVSGAGAHYVKKLLSERTKAIDEKREIDLNVIPQIGNIEENRYCEEENKMHFEIRKILQDDKIEIVATTVRVPVICGHSESIYAEFEQEFTLSEAVQIWEINPLVKYLEKGYVTPYEIEGSDLSYVCRLRKGFDDKSILFWNVADNVRTGAATNAVRILQIMMNGKIGN